MMQRDKQQWIEQVMSSLDHLPPARPARDLYSRIAQEISAGRKDRERVIPFRTVSAAAAVLLILLAVNFMSVFGKRHAGKTDSLDAVTRYYDFNNDYVQIDL
jgi:hypothetical protein